MRLLVDECTGPAVARWLQGLGHDVVSIYDQARGATDDAIIARAVDEGRILITNDKDFGEKVYRQNHAHKGVILLRLSDERSVCKIAALQRFFSQYTEHVAGRFVVVTEKQVRFADPFG